LPVLQRHPRQHPGHPERRRDTYPARCGLSRGMQSPGTSSECRAWRSDVRRSATEKTSTAKPAPTRNMAAAGDNQTADDPAAHVGLPCANRSRHQSPGGQTVTGTCR
jgi:hypothetical protein